MAGSTRKIEPDLQPVVATCQLAWRPAQLLLALYVRDTFQIPTRGLSLPPLTPSVHELHNADRPAVPPLSRNRLAEQWYSWWRETLDAIDLADTGRPDWSVLYGEGDHPELSVALDAVFGPATRWLRDRTSAWESLREAGIWGSRIPRVPTEVSDRWFRGAPVITVYVAVVPFEGLFARQLRESLFVTSWDLAIDEDAFASWVRPLLRARVDAEVERLG